MNSNLLTRREVLRWCGIAAASSVLCNCVSAAPNPLETGASMDHLLLGAADLDLGIAWVEKLTGLRAVTGGSHPGVGTRNALISLGKRQYLEIIGPDPAQTAYNFQIDVRKLTEPRLITWAAATTHLEQVAKQARTLGHQVFGPREGSRARPDGQLLRWKSLGVLNSFGNQGIEPMPFFIEWAADSRHPSNDSPKGCELRSFEIEHPSAATLNEALKNLGVQTTVKQSKTIRLTATLKTPKGEVVIC